MDINLEQRSNTKALSSWNTTYFSTKDNAIHISLTSEAASHNTIYSSHLNSTICNIAKYRSSKEIAVVNRFAVN